MTTMLEDLQARVEVLERQMTQLTRLAGDDTAPAPAGNVFEQWLATRRQQPLSPEKIRQIRRDLGISPDLPRVGAAAVQELMLAEGIDPADRILSSELVRMREETRP